MPPFMLFSTHCEPGAALEALRELMPNISVTVAGEDWREATGVWKRGMLKKNLTLRVKNNPDYYGNKASFAMQIIGMANYLRGFPGAEERPGLFACVRNLTFALSFQFEPDLEEDDPRYGVLLALTQGLDGFIFVPGTVLDGSGRVILSAEGEMDPEAEIPAVDEEEEEEEGDEDEDAEEAPGEPPSATRVAQRLQVLIASAARGFVEQAHGDGEARQNYAENLIGALEESGAWEEAEPEEKERLQTPIGQLADRDVFSMTWQCEAAAMMAWALGLRDLPDYDAQVDPQEIATAAGVSLMEGEPEPSAVVEAAELRSSEELNGMEVRIFTLNWRLREFSLRPQAMDFRSFPQRAGFGPLDLGLVKFAGDDLAISGKPLIECSEREWRSVAGVLLERHRAINWLTGQCEIYSETDTST